MSPITTHVLDTSLGLPAEGVAVVLSRFEGGAWVELASRSTDAEGRIRDLVKPGPIGNGIYRMVFDTGAYFRKAEVAGFYPEVSVSFEITDQRHHHIPLLLNPYGYSTYRGS